MLASNKERHNNEYTLLLESVFPRVKKTFLAGSPELGVAETNAKARQVAGGQDDKVFTRLEKEKKVKRK